MDYINNFAYNVLVLPKNNRKSTLPEEGDMLVHYILTRGSELEMIERAYSKERRGKGPYDLLVINTEKEADIWKEWAIRRNEDIEDEREKIELTLMINGMKAPYKLTEDNMRHAKSC